jgi:two-component system chemotaxis response regulator CheY
MARILIVDDSEYFRETLIEFIKFTGHTVAGEAENGAEGLELYKQLRPDLTTMDITMPVMDGIEALRRIIAFDPEARVIMASASAQNRKVNEALILGAYEFLPKPFDKERLLEVITEILADVV